MSVCITGILLPIPSSTPQMSKSASFTQASKALPNFSPIWLRFPRGVCLSLWIPTKQALMASLCITWVNHIPLRKICILCCTSCEVKWERSQTWHHSSSQKRNGCLCTALLNYVELNLLKAMSDISSYKSSSINLQPKRVIKKKKCICLCHDAVQIVLSWQQFHS